MTRRVMLKILHTAASTWPRGRLVGEEYTGSSPLGKHPSVSRVNPLGGSSPGRVYAVLAAPFGNLVLAMCRVVILLVLISKVTSGDRCAATAVEHHNVKALLYPCHMNVLFFFFLMAHRMAF